MTTPIHVAYSSAYLNWHLGTGHPTNPIRAKNAVDLLTHSPHDVRLHRPEYARWEDLLLVHDEPYADEIVNGFSDEWAGERTDLADTASLMFGGTQRLVDLMLEDDTVRLAFNPQGAKHHAMRNYSSGFCVFNDFAAAAIRFADQGLRVAYVDWDAHHGDGVEELLRMRSDIRTYSIHDATIFPGTGRETMEQDGVYNCPLAAGAGNAALAERVRRIGQSLSTMRPDVLLLAIGADGHEKDPLSSLTYTTGGLVKAARVAATWAPRVLVGGAGGYRPHDVTPEVWAKSVMAIAESMSE